LNDPRLSPVISVTAVEVNRDLSVAKVYVSILGTDTERSDAIDGLRSAANRLRMEVSNRIVIRTMPKLSFFPDDTLQSGADIDQLIDRVIAQDSRRHSDRDTVDG
jgi:ribosome-binding factor A